jgi:hypothetical protein
MDEPSTLREPMEIPLPGEVERKKRQNKEPQETSLEIIPYL